MHYELWTDGACSGNPGPGGWAYIVRIPNSNLIFDDSGYVSETTNNRMELLAVIEGLRHTPYSTHVVVFTDSKYVKQGITEWIKRWKKNGWLTANKKPVKNRDLWERLDALCQNHQVEWNWVEGHSGCELNECVDEMARAAIGG